MPDEVKAYGMEISESESEVEVDVEAKKSDSEECEIVCESLRMEPLEPLRRRRRW